MSNLFGADGEVISITNSKELDEVFTNVILLDRSEDLPKRIVVEVGTDLVWMQSIVLENEACFKVIKLLEKEINKMDDEFYNREDGVVKFFGREEQTGGDCILGILPKKSKNAVYMQVLEENEAKREQKSELNNCNQTGRTTF